MAKKALKKKKRQKNIIFKIALIVFAVAVSTELISLQVSIASKKRENETMEQKVAQQMKENDGPRLRGAHCTRKAGICRAQ